VDFVEDLLEPAFGEFIAIDVAGVDHPRQLIAQAAIAKNSAALEWR
jgi:hypothetical protein